MAQLPTQKPLRPSSLLVLCFLCASTLQANQLETVPAPDPVSDEQPDTPPSTVIVWGSMGNQDANDRTLDALRAQLSDLNVRLKSIPHTAPDGAFVEQINLAKSIASRENALLVVWIDSGREDTEILFISHPASDRLLVREIFTKGRNPEGLSETIAVIVRASAKAVIQGHEIGFDQPSRALMGVQESPRTTDQAPPPPPALVPDKQHIVEETRVQPQPHFGLSLGYGAFLTTRDAAPFHGPAARLHLRARWINAFAGYQHRFKNKLDDESIVLELTSGRICAGLLAGAQRGPNWRFEGGLEFGLTFVQANSTARAQSFEATSPQLRWVFGIAPKVVVSRRILGRLDAYAAISVDVQLKRIEYVVVTSSGNDRVLGFWRFQPFFEIGLIFFDFVRPSFVQNAQ